MGIQEITSFAECIAEVCHKGSRTRMECGSGIAGIWQQGETQDPPEFLEGLYLSRTVMILQILLGHYVVNLLHR